MRIIHKIRYLFWLSVFFQFLMSGSILLMPMAVEMAEQNRMIMVFIGLMFWISAIASYVMMAIANSKRKRFIIQKADKNVKMNCRAGIAEFFANVPATVADVTMLLSLIIFDFVCFTKWKYEYISYVLLFLLVFSLHMHCMFNGRIYKVTKYKHTRGENDYE